MCGKFTQALLAYPFFSEKWQVLLSSYMEYIESIGFTPKILKIFFAQIMFFTDKKS
jgi:hypothetical protein